LIKTNSGGNSAVVHFGGDGSNTAKYRTNLRFYNNTVVAKRSSGSITLLGLSASANPNQVVDARNLIFAAAPGAGALFLRYDNGGTYTISNSWLAHGISNGGTPITFVNTPTNNATLDPGFVAIVSGDSTSSDDYHLTSGSAAIDAGGALGTGWDSVADQYTPVGRGDPRAMNGTIDQGAFEL